MDKKQWDFQKIVLDESYRRSYLTEIKGFCSDLKVTHGEAMMIMFLHAILFELKLRN